MDFQVGVGATGVTVGISRAMLGSLATRFSRRTLYGGPCMLIDRHTGLALDSTTEPRHRTRPVLWTPHGLPWQQWRIVRVKRGIYKILSEHGDLALSTDHAAGDGSWVWLEKYRDREDQLWRLEATEDHTAFVVETKRSAHSLDATLDPRIPAAAEDGWIGDPSSPILWETHSQAWQQWVIVRLPLT